MVLQMALIYSVAFVKYVGRDSESSKTSDPSPPAVFLVGGHESYRLSGIFSVPSLLL